jgi:HAD superfamily hydrolase (TIGR01490 family)
MTAQPAAFFDLDRTLITVNSGKLWFNAERRAGRLTTAMMLRAGFFMLGYKLGWVNMQKAMQSALATIKGMDEAPIKQRTAEWYKREVAPTAAPGAAAAIAWHRAQGHSCILLTASSPYEAELARVQFKLDAALSTVYEVADGKFTGRVVEPLCYGAGKVQWAEQYAAQHDIDLDHSYFYTDSVTDLPMLERVAHPRIVLPDARLARIARQRNWKLLNWNQA